MSNLHQKHIGQVAWIIGKGPSLEFLRAEHFGPGPVIALNHAIMVVENLQLVNPVYSLQKDGQCVRPISATLVLHDLESGGIYPDYPVRHVFSLPMLGLNENVFSLIFAGRLAQFMGCDKARFLCCDLYATGDRRTFVPLMGVSPTQNKYLNQPEHLDLYLHDLKYRHITPEGALE